jgi:NADH-quinone oxidoreductase subunit A
MVFLVLGGIVGGAFAALNSFIGPRRQTPHKQDPYECGLPSEIKRGMRFGISFYLIAMLFILFDLEVVFLFPIAVELRAFGKFALIETIVFVVLLLVALGYVWRRGALEWK